MIVQRYITKNDGYAANVNKQDERYIKFHERGPLGIMIHSIGTPQPNAEVLINNWNVPGKEVNAHAFVDANNTVWQIMPWNFRGWHAGGSANNTHIGVELTEPSTIRYTGGANWVEKADGNNTRNHVMSTYNTAVKLFAQLCKQYDLDPIGDGVIISHSEGYRRGVASNHGDVEHLWSKFGLSMKQFRIDIKNATGQSHDPIAKWYRVRTSWDDASGQIGAYKKLENAKKKADENPGYKVYGENGVLVYDPEQPENAELKVRVSVDDLRIRVDAGTEFDVVGICPEGVYTIVSQKENGGYTWGKLKSGAGWIALEYTSIV